MPTDEEMLAELEALESGLSGWEVDFIESIRGRVDDVRALTEGQHDKLADIWEKKCNS